MQVSKDSPLNNIKSCNYLERILALEAASASGFDEAVRINEDSEIVSACMANIFWINDGKIYTPAVETGCLEGTTRAFVMGRCKVVTVEMDLESLRDAESVFLTSAGLGIAVVSSLMIGKVRIEYKPIGDDFFGAHNLKALQ
jgi:branched-chain amino acid aminotransferase/4-amino-4-deoxychorismate lyase